MSGAGLPEDVAVAPGPPPDIDRLTEFLREVTAAQEGRPSYTRDFLEAILSMPGLDLSRDMVLVHDGDGELVGVEWLHHANPWVRHHLSGYVAPHRTGEGIGSHLLSWAVERIGDFIPMAPDGARVTVATGIHPGHEPSVSLLESRGFETDRYFIEMRRELAEPLGDAPLPVGIALRHYVAGEVEALYDAVDDAFQDHFGHVAEPREQGIARFERWTSMEGFDPTLTWLAMAGDEIAGSIICFPDQDGDDTVGYVGSLGVRRPWRGQGLGKALLLVAFDEFHKRGKQAAALHVDAASITGATRLYESVGMRETERFMSMELELRPGAELIVR